MEKAIALALGVLGIAGLACSTDSRDFGEGTPNGGTGGGSGSGGDGGASASGGQGGASATGGGGQGAAGSGGSGGTGGAAASGGAGGGGTGGAAGSDGGATARFRGGPCVASPENTSAEVFARGEDRRIYRRVLAGTDLGSWAALGDLDGTGVDNRSDLDCGGNATSIHITALGLQPPGAFLHAVGFGTTYNEFAHELTAYSFLPSPSIAVGFSDYLLAGLLPAFIHATNVGASSSDLLPANATSFPWWGLDTAKLSTRSANSIYFLAFDSSSQLVLYEHRSQSGGPVWVEPVRFPAPPNQTYEHGSAICGYYEGTTTNIGQVHLIVTASGQLWHTSKTSSETAWPAWRRLTADSVASAPDCVLTSDGVLHVVALDAAGGVIVVRGSPGNMVATDLGSY